MEPQEDKSSVDPQKALGDAVRALRKELGLSQQDLAERAGLPPSWLAHLESGRHDPTWGDMRRLAAGLEVSLEKLSELAEELEGGQAPEANEHPSPS
jgi:transcriptional regulator with XRE-family HTH domain